VSIDDVYDFVVQRLVERDRRNNGPQLCRDAADRVEALPHDAVGDALVELLRKTAWMGDLDREHLARIPCDEILTLAEAILAQPASTGVIR
jgi:hypothetical protein